MTRNGPEAGVRGIVRVTLLDSLDDFGERLDGFGGALRQRDELNAIRKVLTGDRAQFYDLKRAGWRQVWESPMKAAAIVLVAASLLLSCSVPTEVGGYDDPIEYTGPNSCEHAFDGECDEPGYCAVGTDTADCGSSEPDDPGTDSSNPLAEGLIHGWQLIDAVYEPGLAELPANAWPAGPELITGPPTVGTSVDGTTTWTFSSTYPISSIRVRALHRDEHGYLNAYSVFRYDMPAPTESPSISFRERADSSAGVAESRADRAGVAAAFRPRDNPFQAFSFATDRGAFTSSENCNPFSDPSQCDSCYQQPCVRSSDGAACTCGK